MDEKDKLIAALRAELNEYEELDRVCVNLGIDPAKLLEYMGSLDGKMAFLNDMLDTIYPRENFSEESTCQGICMVWALRDVLDRLARIRHSEDECKNWKSQ